MGKFRSKLIVIDAWQFKDWDYTSESTPDWMGDLYDEHNHVVASACGEKLYINTLEGGATAQLGDWIIRGAKGEIYPCKPDVFAQTYEAAPQS